MRDNPVIHITGLKPKGSAADIEYYMEDNIIVVWNYGERFLSYGHIKFTAPRMPKTGKISSAVANRIARHIYMPGDGITKLAREIREKF